MEKQEERQEYFEALKIYTQVIRTLEAQINAISENTIKSEGVEAISLFGVLQITLEDTVEVLKKKLKKNMKLNNVTDEENDKYVKFYDETTFEGFLKKYFS